MRRDEMSYSDRSDLERVNKEVNQFPYRTDPEQFGRWDDWTPADESGADCESYAMAKFSRLVRLGWPPQNLRLACCYVEPSAASERVNRYHGVLVVALEDGTERVLDNRYPFPMPLRELRDNGYEPDRIQMAIWPRGVHDWEPWRWA